MTVSYELFLDWVKSSYTPEQVILIDAYGSSNESSLRRLEHLRGNNLVLGDCYGGNAAESNSAGRNTGEFKGLKLQTIDDLRIFSQATLNDAGNEVSWGPRPYIFDPNGAILKDGVWIPIAAKVYNATPKRLEIKFFYDGNKYLTSV